MRAASLLLGTVPGRVLLVGIALTLGGILFILAVSLSDPAAGATLLGVALAHAAVGRETSIPAALAAGWSVPAATAYAFYLDAVNLITTLPLLVLLEGTLRRRFPRLDAWLAEEEARARALPPRRKASGLLALGGASVVPFLPVGAVASGVAGVVLGYSFLPLLGVLLLAAFVTDVAFGVASGWITEALARLHPLAPWAFVGLVLLGVVAATLRRRPRSRPGQ